MPLALQCPRCHGSVSVADDAAGKRVTCPHCEKPFLAPGLAASENDDDDWLKLDDDPVAAKPVTAKPVAAKPVATKPAAASSETANSNTPGMSAKPASKSNNGGSLPFDDVDFDAVDLGDLKLPEQFNASAKPAVSNSKFSPDDEALLAEFTSELDDFTAEVESIPKPIVATSTKAAGAAGGKPAELAAPTHQNEYRVHCNICSSVTHAKASQAGKTIKCPDCHSAIVVPPPPKIQKKVEINMDEAASFQFEESQIADRRPDPYTKSATALLDEAAREETVSGPHKYEDQPDLVQWLKDVFGVFTDSGVVMHWIVLSVLASVPAFFILSTDISILRLALIVGGFIMGGMVVGCGFAIMQSVANQEDHVSEWPTFDPFGWLGTLFVAFAAAGVAFIPVWMACSFVFGQNLISVAITMFSVYTLFPFVLLSMLDMGSPLVPFSAEVARSVTKCQESWGGFYFSSGLLFVCLFLLLAALSTMSPPVGAVIAIVAVIGIAFTYFAMIGRLAYSIGQAVNDPPMKNDIDRSRKTDAI
ncbi:zinc ribbon domain-containing protein [Rubripirellula reticaptiva]|uniref:Uncharacterized protein n=1 Tax=Rubripirellula reticaptiva TaxID=2528013 RepID=A0A5C6EJV8_9BACT|nr:hypothetical protein [Rubripirellula reticaptiva]TWU48397.1 hypothetical protein Poly59_52450 [Rubripirellula reticaptiva]